jgi:hypothetical protein
LTVRDFVFAYSPWEIRDAAAGEHGFFQRQKVLGDQAWTIGDCSLLALGAGQTPQMTGAVLDWKRAADTGKCFEVIGLLRLAASCDQSRARE